MKASLYLDDVNQPKAGRLGLAFAVTSTIYVGIVMLAIAVTLSTSSEFGAVGPVGNSIAEQLFPQLAPLAATAQSLFFLGALVLLVSPIYDRVAIFIVLQSIAAVSAMIPAAQLPWIIEVLIRLAVTYAGVITLCALNEVPWRVLVFFFWPPYWVETVAGKNKKYPKQLCVLGSELLGWGYSIIATNHLIASLLVFVGCGFLALFAWRGMKQKYPLCEYWFVLNLIYAAGFGLQAIHRIWILVYPQDQVYHL